jgi:hypothetical protein
VFNCISKEILEDMIEAFRVGLDLSRFRDWIERACSRFDAIPALVDVGFEIDVLCVLDCITQTRQGKRIVDDGFDAVEGRFDLFMVWRAFVFS